MRYSYLSTVIQSRDIEGMRTTDQNGDMIKIEASLKMDSYDKEW